MFHNRTRNIIINKEGRKESLPPDDTVIRLAGYYTRIFADTLEKMHMTREQKSRELSAVNLEYKELLSASRSVGMVS